MKLITITSEESKSTNVATTMPEYTPFEKRFNRYNDSRCPGLAAMAIQDGVTLFKKGFGLRNLETGESITPSTNFDLASLSKQFTAMCIAILEDRNQLAASDYIQQYFSDLPSYMNEIKVSHLVHHLSGLPDYSRALWSSDKNKPMLSNRDVYEYYRQQHALEFAPGEKHEYSNGGYSLLPLLIEIITDVPYPMFVKENIFKPANMHDTVTIEYPSNIKNQAASYSEWPFFENIDYNTGNALQGEGGVYTSLNDMEGWIHALMNHTLISPEMTRKVFSPAKNNDGQAIDYGYGWGFMKNGDIDIILHSGSWLGFNTSIGYIPKMKYWSVAFSNTFAISSEDAAKAMAKHYLGGSHN